MIGLAQTIAIETEHAGSGLENRQKDGTLKMPVSKMKKETGCMTALGT